MAVSCADDRIRPERDSDREYLCQAFVYTLSLALIVLGWAWGVVLIALGIHPFASLFWIAPLALLLLGAGSHYWHKWHLRWATGLALLAVWLAVAITAHASGNPLFLFGYASVIIVGGVLSGPLVTTVAAGVSAWHVLQMRNAWSPTCDLTLALLISIAVSLGLSWLLWHHLYIALQLSWDSHQRATREMLKARQRRAELRRALKALDEEYDRLARLNLELIEARREAEDARRLKAEFAANVSHELRTPINLIVGFSEMMYAAPESYGGQFLPPEYLGDVHAVYRSARHLQTLIDDILDLAKIDAKRMGLNREVARIETVVSEAVEAIRELVDRKGLALLVEVEPSLPQVYVDRVRIRQVLLNLISNAARFTEKGHIRVSCGLCASDASSLSQEDHLTDRGVYLPHGRYVRVSVSDSGFGIPPADLGKVFEEFRQLDGSVRRTHGGTGLGLAISKRFVELHGGWMWVESELGKGSTFHFALPPADEPWMRSELVATQSRDVARPVEKAMVVIDDDPNVVRLFRRYMQNYRIEGAPNVQEAMQLTAELGPELLVLGNGAKPEEVMALQDTRPDLADARLTVLCYPLPSEHRKALALGMTDFLTKPVTRDELLRAIHRLGVSVRTLLAIEDDPGMMRLLSRMLTEAGSSMNLHKAYNAEEAQEFLRSKVPDLVLLDLALPGMSGQELLDWMRQRQPLSQVPVIVITAQAHLEEIEPLEVATITLSRRERFSIPELLAFAQTVAESFPSRYAPAQAIPTPPSARRP